MSQVSGVGNDRALLMHSQPNLDHSRYITFGFGKIQDVKEIIKLEEGMETQNGI
jgi:hypothetical protein